MSADDPTTPSLEDIAAVQALHGLVADYCEELDTTGGLGATRYMTPDCRMAIGNMQLCGHPEIDRFYRDFAQKAAASGSGARTTRHLAANLRVRLRTKEEATVDVLMLNFSASGVPPIMAGTIPTVVSDLHLGCRRCADGRWRIFDFAGGPVFVGDDPLQNQALIKD